MTDKQELVVEQQNSLPVMAQPHMRLIEIAVEKGADITQLEKLMDLQERYEAGQALKSYNKSMSIFQSLLPVIEKKGNVFYQGKNGKADTDYDYAKLEDITKAIRPALKKSGISYRWTQKQKDGYINVTCIATHIDGHSEQNDLFASPDSSGGKDGLKAIASTISYLRRYTLTGLLGITVGGEDTDGSTNFNHDVNNEDQEGFCSTELFNESFPAGEAKILSKEKTPAQIIAFFERKVKLTDKQKEIINNVGKA